MQENKVGAIHLSGEDADSFAESIFMPTEKEIVVRNKYLDEINKNILISETDNGFEADIANLDLSFLDEKCLGIKLQFQVQICSKMKPRVYNQTSKTTSEAYYPYTNLQYSGMNCESNIIWAA